MNILPIDSQHSPSPPLEHGDEKEESRSLVLRSGNVLTQSTETAEITAVTETVREVFKGFTDAVYQGPRNIDRWDNDLNFLRYDFPNLSLSDYLGSVSKICGYHGNGISITNFENVPYQDRLIGCFAKIYLRKSREQSEDDYEDILRAFPGERHALHTDVKSDWGVCLSRKFSHDYVQKSQERRKQQLDGMQKAVDVWNSTDKFDRVFIPSIEFRIKELKHFPEYVACTDIIILAYKSLPPVLNLKDGKTGGFLQMPPPASESQPIVRIRWDNLNRPWYRKVFDATPSISRRSNRAAHVEEIEEASPPAVSATVEAAPDRPSSPNEPQEPPSPKENFFSFFLESSGHA